jgi:hypothetical protein
MLGDDYKTSWLTLRYSLQPSVNFFLLWSTCLLQQSILENHRLFAYGTLNSLEVTAIFLKILGLCISKLNVIRLNHPFFLRG